MDKSAIKNFAVNARIKLMDQITQKAFELGISTENILEPELFADGFRVNGKVFKKYEIKQRQELVKQIQKKGLSQVIEEVAYIWFNRLIAIRFMEVNEYLPIGVRVLSSTDQGKTEPDVVREVLQVELDLTEDDLAVVYRLQDEHNTEELFKYILVKQCNKLGDIMPVLFEQIADYTELLLPDNLLGEGSVIRDLVTTIAEEDWQEQVEIIGWLYQYYISQKKDEVFADLKKNKKITKDNIPAATQLFTPDWIVKYMVENSLGRQWLESHPDAELQSKWKYYLEQAEQEPEVLEQLADLKNPNLTPEEIKVLDPCMGSGHILVYAFDVFYDIYKSAGYSERDIPKLIIKKNLYGLDIDDRAAQLAYFAVMMKARSYNRRLFREELAHNLCGIQESNAIPKNEVLEIFARLADGELWSAKLRSDVEYLIDVFYDAKEYGSIIEVKDIDFNSIEQAVEDIHNQKIVLDVFSAPHREVILKIIPVLIQQGRILSQKYDVVCTNPPYMGTKGMNEKLKEFALKNYPDSKSDLFAMFIERNLHLVLKQGVVSMITMQGWMFLLSFERLRERILNENIVTSMAHLGTRAFDSIGGEVVSTTAFVIKKGSHIGYKASYLRLIKGNCETDKEVEFQNSRVNPFVVSSEVFEKIPGTPISYWVSELVLSLFDNKKIDDLLFSEGPCKTGNDEQYLRFHWEVNALEVNHNDKWCFCSKGGNFRKYYGNIEHVIKWNTDSRRHYKEDKIARITAEYVWDREGITWSIISARDGNSFRLLPYHAQFNSVSPTLFLKNDINVNLKFLLAYLNSAIVCRLLSILNPTLALNVGNVLSLPVKEVAENVEKNIDLLLLLAKTDWDYFEKSWDFTIPPLLKKEHRQTSLQATYLQTRAQWRDMTNDMRQLEEKNNRIFIEAYSLQEEILYEVPINQITLNCNPHYRYGSDKTEFELEGLLLLDTIKEFVSYAIGCMFGRYSLDEPGLIYAGGDFDASRYQTFTANTDNILPLTDDEYFEDDIVSRFTDFVSIIFGKETLEENLDYIAETLNRKANETSRQAIRRYFLKDFYKDHVQTYQKRPIYWLFDSGKNDGFKALIYMHRYDLSTVAKVRTDYLHILQRKYETEMSRQEMTMDPAISPTEKVAAKKKQEKLQKQLSECYQYDQVIAHVANQGVSIDLDDGVKVNYAKFQEIQIPQGDGKKPLKVNLLAII